MATTYNKIYLAPLAGYTDLPFRRVCRRQGLQYAYTALIDAGALVYGNKENRIILARGDDEPWLGVQLLGSRLDFIEKAVPILNEMPYDEFNFNMGCPVKKVVQRDAGAALLKHPEHALDCVRLIRKLVKRPFTVKIRILSETDTDATVQFCRKLVEEGVEGIFIHGRVATKVYSGPVAAEIISAVREAVAVPVVANGGIFTWEDGQELARRTGCEGIMVARGAIGNPWLFKSLLEGHEVSPTHGELCDMIDLHLRSMMELYGEEDGLVNGRKIILGYLGGRGYHRSLKLDVCSIRKEPEFNDLLKRIREDRDSAEIVPQGKHLVVES